MLIIFNIQSHAMVRVCVKLNAYDSFAKMQSGRTIEMYSNIDVNRMKLNGLRWNETSKTHLRARTHWHKHSESEKWKKGRNSKNDTGITIDHTNFGYRNGNFTLRVNVRSQTYAHALACLYVLCIEMESERAAKTLSPLIIYVIALDCVEQLEIHASTAMPFPEIWTIN